MLLFLKDELEEKGFVVTAVDVNHQVIRLYVWNDQTNEIVCGIRSTNRIDYSIKTYEVDNITEEKKIILNNATYEELINTLGDILPILKER